MDHTEESDCGFVCSICQGIVPYTEGCQCLDTKCPICGQIYDYVEGLEVRLSDSRLQALRNHYNQAKALVRNG